MQKRTWVSRWGVGAWMLGICLMTGADPSFVVSPAYAATKPVPPQPLAVTGSPITFGSGDLGYLPGSAEVTPQGQFNYSIPLDVPAGRMGMQPALALNYSSSGSNGVLGVGWSLSGMSSISGCAHSLASDGEVRGVHLTDSTTTGAASDRFCLDGKKLVAINGAYGAVGTEYRTEEDSYIQVIAAAAPASIAQSAGEPMFTVRTSDGHTRSYTALYTTAWHTALSGPVTRTGTYDTGTPRAILMWALTSEVDASGNGVQYLYRSAHQAYPGTTWGASYAQMAQYVLASIVYTSSTDLKDEGHRHVDFTYEDSPLGTAVDFGFHAGTASALFQRLKTITMFAPNPAQTLPVWQYDVTYTRSSFSSRNLVDTIKRCALDTAKDPMGGIEAGCTWSKKFEWTHTVFNGVWFNSPQVVEASIPVSATASDGSANPVMNATGSHALFDTVTHWSDNIPMVRVLDADGDGRDDVLLQHDGPGYPDVVLYTAAPNTPAGPVGVPLTTRNTLTVGEYTPGMDTASGEREGLAYVQPLDFKGNGTTQLYVTQQVQASATAVTCQDKVLQWSGAALGFRDIKLELPPYDCSGFAAQSPNANLFLDLDGDGRVDQLQAPTLVMGGTYQGNPIPTTWDTGSPPPTGVWQTAKYNTGQTFAPSLSAPPGIGTYATSSGQKPLPVDDVTDNQGTVGMGNSAWSGCQTYAVDFSGDGHAQLFGSNARAYAYPGQYGAYWQSLFLNCGFVPLKGVPYTGDTVVSINQSVLQTYDAASGKWQAVADIAAQSNATDIAVDPAYPVMEASLGGVGPRGTYYHPQSFLFDILGVTMPIPLTPKLSTTPKLIFGDFNGDGLEDVIEPDLNEGKAAAGKYYLRWNTGDGFGPRIPLQMPFGNAAIFKADGTIDTSVAPVYFQVYATDLNHDGRADLVIFTNYPQSTLNIWLSNGDGSFTSGSSVGANNGGMFFGTSSTAAIGDFDGDGFADILWLKGSATEPNGIGSSDIQANLMVSTQLPALGDRINAVYDEPTVWPRVAVTYSLQASDKPEPVAPCVYPQRCNKKGAVVVREIEYRDTLVNPASAQVQAPHTIYYSYEDAVSDLRGRGGLGYRKVREWDPTQLRQTITEYDNRTQAQVTTPTTHTGQNYYPGAMRPAQVTTVTVIPSLAAPQTVPQLHDEVVQQANARVVQTRFITTTQATHHGATYVIQPQQQVTVEWEQSVYMVSSVLNPGDPTSDYLWNATTSAPFTIMEPAHPLRKSFSTVGLTDADDTPIGCVDAASHAVACIDDYGHVLTRTDHTVGGVLRRTDSAFLNDMANWRLGLATASSVIATEPDGTSVKRGSSYDYDSHGLLAHSYRLQFADASDVHPVILGTTTLTRDSFGNVVNVAVQAMGPHNQLETRQVNVEYDAPWPAQPDERIFPSQRWVPTPYPGTTALPSTWRVVQPAYGLVVQTMNVMGVQTRSQYDDQGNLRGVFADGQSPISIAYAGRPDTFGGMNGLIVTKTMLGQVSTVASDADGRGVAATHTGFDGAVIQDSQVSYDLLGRVTTATRPVLLGSPPAYYAAYDYDGLNRVLTTTAPDNTAQVPVKTKITSTFFTTTLENADGHLSRSTRDVNGRLVSSVNQVASAWIGSTYAYAPFDQVARVTDPAGNVESLSYDTLGRTVESVSPDAGTTTNIHYDGFDELLGSTHLASGATTSLDYDVLGRKVQWSNSDGPTGATLTYDTQPNGLGQLATTVSSDGVATLSHYDTLGRLISTDETVDGLIYATGMTYQGDGRLSQILYPGVPATNGAFATQAGSGMILQYGYNGVGYASTLTYQTANQSAALMTVMAQNTDDALVTAQLGTAGTLQNTYIGASGRLKETQLLPAASAPQPFDLNYDYYPSGLVQKRTDLPHQRSESYAYDELDRLASWQLDSCSSVPCAAPGKVGLSSYAYDPTGNLKTITYSSASNNSNPVTLQDNAYGSGAGVLPHALTAQTADGATTAYHYDNHGRAHDGLAIGQLDYNAFDLPVRVTSNGSVWRLKYDAFGHRAEKSGPDGTVISIGGYEHRVLPGGTTDVFQVPGIAQVQIDGTGAASVIYTLTDTLGSVDVTLDGKTGKPITSLFYDPFGSRITSDGSPFFGRGHLTRVGTVEEGFTGQQHDDDWGLINFRGRMYSPSLKRFLTADPHVTSPGFSQSWNRYSYVNNSPLNANDPTGFDGESTAPTYSGFAPPPGCPAGGYYYYDNIGNLNYTYNEPDADASSKMSTVIKAISPDVATMPIVYGASDDSNLGPPTETERRADEMRVTDAILNEFSALSDKSPALKAALDQLRLDGVVIDRKPMSDALGYTVDAKHITLRQGNTFHTDASVIAHEALHATQYRDGLNIPDAKLQDRESYMATIVDGNEMPAEAYGFLVTAQLVSAGEIGKDELLDHANNRLSPVSVDSDLYKYVFSTPGNLLDQNKLYDLSIKAAQDLLAPGTQRRALFDHWGNDWEDAQQNLDEE